MIDLPPYKQKPFNHFSSSAMSKIGGERHRGRDLVLSQSDKEQWILGKFAYGPTDKDLVDEDVEIFLIRNCGKWIENLGTFRTTRDDDHEDVEGVKDTGGRIYVDLTKRTEPLSLGYHRIVMRVLGDGTTTDQFIQIVEPYTPFVISDIDGTLTTSEYAAWTELYGTLPEANPGAAEVIAELHKKGFQILYLTARPEWLKDATRNWLNSKKFPFGIVHTTLSKSGVIGSSAAQYKISELESFTKRVTPSIQFAFGNKKSDVEAYSILHLPNPKNAYYFKLEDSANMNGTIHQDYRSLLPVVQKDNEMKRE